MAFLPGSNRQLHMLEVYVTGTPTTSLQTTGHAQMLVTSALSDGNALSDCIDRTAHNQSRSRPHAGQAMAACGVCREAMQGRCTDERIEGIQVEGGG